MSITLIVGILAFLVLMFTIRLDKKPVKPTKCQQCDDEYGNCWKCKEIEYPTVTNETESKIIKNGFKSVNKL